MIELKPLLRAPAVGGAVVSTRVSNELLEIVEDMAREFGVSRSELVRYAIVYAVRNKQEFRKFIESITSCPNV
jgi:metal-responsive CopG/Arc/MetJ family transcriptional regulator